MAAVPAPVTALVAGAGSEPAVRLGELRRAAAARVGAGRGPVRLVRLPGVAHNLMRYVPAAVCAAILDAGPRG
jgi:hypothetical protein